MYQTCEYCEKSFHAERVTARFCSTKCRVKFNREQKRHAAIESVSSKGDKLALLMDESDKISQQIKAALNDIRFNRNVKQAWFVIDDLRPRNSQIIREIADLVAN